MNSKKELLSEETLEERAFERSKWWSNFLNEVKTDEEEPIHLNDMEKVYGNDDDEGEWTDFEEAEEVSEGAAESGALDVTTSLEKRTFIESSEVQDLLNATLPILKEHQRKWEAAGLERILNTFDSVRIEREVGGWMRRNHTTNLSNKCTTGSDSDSDSLLSNETADYIRSTQKKKTQRRRRCMSSIGRFKKFHRIHHNHGTVYEATTYRAYNCNCGKYNLNEDNRQKKSIPFDQQEIIYTSDKDTLTKKSEVLLPQSERRLQRFDREYSSSSDSDYVSHKSRSFLRSGLPHSRTSDSLYSKHSVFGHKALAIADLGSHLVSTNGSKYETPPRSTLTKLDFTKTAPSKISKKRQAAKKVLEKFCQRDELLETDSTDKTEKGSSSENGTTLDMIIQKAKALSLITKKANQNKCRLSTNKRKESSNDSKKSVGSVSSTDTMKSFNAPRISLQQSIPQYPLRKLNCNREEAKENTFLTNQDNICNSTALNNAAAGARQQLPSIGENSEIMSSTRYDTGTRTKIIGRMLNINECSLSSSPSMLGVEEEVKKVHHPKSVHNFLASKELVKSTPPKERFTHPCTPTHVKNQQNLQHTPAARIGQKRQSIGSGRKSSTVLNNVTPVLLNVGEGKTKSISSLDIVRKPKRIVIYKPEQKNHASNGYFQVTREILSSVIGEQHAERFLKYNLGQLTFPKTSTVYFCPPEIEFSSSDSDDDPLEKAGLCGELCMSE